MQCSWRWAAPGRAAAAALLSGRLLEARPASYRVPAEWCSQRRAPAERPCTQHAGMGSEATNHVALIAPVEEKHRACTCIASKVSW